LLLELELELIQSHMAQKQVLRGEVGCACVAREEVWASAGVQGAWVGACRCEADKDVFVFLLLLAPSFEHGHFAHSFYCGSLVGAGAI